MYVNLFSQLEYAQAGVLVRERDIDAQHLSVLAEAGLVEYAGIDMYSDCHDCPLGTGCPVERMGGTDDDPEYVAICPAGEYLIYREADLRQWRLTAPAVARVLLDQVGEASHVEEIVPHRLWSVGRIGRDVSVFLFLGIRRKDAAMIAAPLHERLKLHKGLVVVFAELPATGVLPQHAVAVSLGEVLRVEETAVVVDREHLEGLAASLVGTKVKSAHQPISTPAHFTWSQVRIEFISDEDVRIWTVGEPVVKTYEELGMANTRNGRPLKSWQLLWEFAGHEGVYDLSHPSVLYAPEKIAHRGSRQPLTAFSGKLGTALSDLAGHLSKLFPTIPGRPIAEYDARKHQYRAEIRLGWEPGYRERKRREYRGE